MKNFDSNKEIKKANMHVGFWKETTDILFLSSIAMAVVCVGASTVKALHLGKNHFPFTSLALTSFVSSLSMFFLASMSRIIRDETISNRDRLLENQNKKNPERNNVQTITHHSDMVDKTHGKERQS